MKPKKIKHWWQDLKEDIEAGCIHFWEKRGGMPPSQDFYFGNGKKPDNQDKDKKKRK
mgnify:CR=1 FL=1|jgi:hypothetical protein